jgi:predicted glycosyltransferase
MLSVILLSVILLSVIILSGYCRFADCHGAKRLRYIQLPSLVLTDDGCIVHQCIRSIEL